MSRSRLDRRRFDLALVALFVAALWAPVVVWAIRGEPDASYENRRLAPPPGVPDDLQAAATWPRRFEQFFDDRFGLRRELVRLHTRAHLPLGVTGVPRVLLGRDRWLFLADDEQTIEQFRGLRVLPPVEVNRWVDTLRAREAWVAARGGAYVFAVVPDKHTVYPEQMPLRLNRARAVTPLDQLVEVARPQELRAFLDLRPALLEAKAAGHVYQPTDTHWNDAGAYAAYVAIARAVSRPGRRMEPWPPAAFDVVVADAPGAGLARLLGLHEDLFREQRVRLVPRLPRQARVRREGRRLVVETGVRGLPRAVVFSDSFIAWLLPFLGEHFERAVVVRQRQFDPGLVEAERADVVIHQMVERYLVYPPHPGEVAYLTQPRGPRPLR
jgi:hypothetical protein